MKTFLSCSISYIRKLASDLFRIPTSGGDMKDKSSRDDQHWSVFPILLSDCDKKKTTLQVRGKIDSGYIADLNSVLNLPL